MFYFLPLSHQINTLNPHPLRAAQRVFVTRPKKGKRTESGKQRKKEGNKLIKLRVQIFCPIIISQLCKISPLAKSDWSKQYLPVS